MKFLWRYFSWVFTLPVFLVAICFAVGNREPTIISFWPLGIEKGLPIYIVALAPLGFGFLFGAAIQWISALRHRVAARRLGKEVAALKAEIAALRAQAAQNSAAPPPAETTPANQTITKFLRGKF